MEIHLKSLKEAMTELKARCPEMELSSEIRVQIAMLTYMIDELKRGPILDHKLAGRQLEAVVAFLEFLDEC